MAAALDQCPKCDHAFAARVAIVDGGIGPVGFFETHEIPPKVRCPRCRHGFPSRTYRYFGLFTPAGMKRAFAWYVVLFLIAFLAVVGYQLLGRGTLQ